MFSCTKGSVIGVGFVGLSFAYSLMIHGTVSEIVLIDIDRKRAEGEAMDLNHGARGDTPYIRIKS